MEEQVTFYCQNRHIFGVIHLPETKPAPAVVMCHGFTGQRSEAHRLSVLTARELAARGVASLRFDFRGSGDSAGDFRDMTISGEIADARAAFQYLASRPEVDADKIGISGLSMGGLVSACLAGRDPRIKAVCLWSAAGDTKRICDKYDEMLVGKDIVDYGGWEVSRAFVEDLRKIAPYEEAAKFAGPVLIIHGANDEVVPVAEAEKYAAVFGEKARLHVINGADHVFSGLAWTRQVMDLTAEFFVAELTRL